MGARLVPMSELYSLFFTSELSIHRGVAIEYACMPLEEFLAYASFSP